MGAGTISAFARATAVTPLGEGAWRATCDPGWSTNRGPNGGYLAAIVLRAMLAELDDPAREPRSLTCQYLRPPAPGELRVDVVVERAGRSVSFVTARLSQDGRPCVLAMAVLSLQLEGALDYAGTPPVVPGPDGLAPAPPVPGLPMTEHFEARPALGAPPFAGADEAVTGGWLRFADSELLDAPALAMYADAWMPSPFARLRAPVGAPTLDLTVHFRAPAAAAAIAADEPVLAVFRSSTSADGFFEEDGELWTADGVLLAQSRQLALIVGAAG
jgi:acyl-CoA thioesterase